MFYLNLLILILTGTLMMGWVLYFTDLFPVIGGLLGLGGLFAWIAFLGNVVSDDRKEELQTFFDEKVLQSKPLSLIAALVIIIFAAAAPARYGTIVINNEQHDRSRTVKIEPVDGKGKKIDFVVPARAEVRQLVDTGLFGSGSFRIKTDGLPWAERSVSWFERQPMAITGDFRRRDIVLIRPSAAKLGAFADESRTLRVTLSGGGLTTDLTLPPHAGYRGEAAWLGAAGDVEPTTDLARSWRFELDRTIKDKRRAQRFGAMWNTPVSLSDDAIAAGTVISARVTRDDGTKPIMKGTATVPASTGGPIITEVIMR